MPDRGDDRGRGSTRTLVAGILAGTEWRPAENPQEATATAREARDLAVRLRPVLSKLAQQPRGGRRRDLDWLPAVEQLAVDAQYFASWWLPRLEGKSSQTWPSWSADGYADWVKRLDAQRVRTLEMVQGSVSEARVASVTPLRRKNKGAGAAEKAAEVGGVAAVDEAEAEKEAPAPIEDHGAADESASDSETGASVHDLVGPAPAGESAAAAARDDSTAVVRDLPAPPPSEPAADRGSGVGARDLAGPPRSQPGAGVRELETPAPPSPRSASAGRHGSPTETLIVRRPATQGGAHAARGSLDLAGTALRPPAVEEAEPPHSDPDLPPPVFTPIPPSKPVDVGRIIRYSLAAVLFAAGCVLVVLAIGQKHKPAANAGQPTSPSSSAPPVSSTSQSSAGGGPVSAPTTSDSPTPASSTSTSPSAPASSTASKPSAATSKSASAPPPVSQPTSQPASDTTVSSLSVVSLAPDQTGSYTFVAHVTVRTTGTGPVDITLTFAGSASLGTPGSVGAQSFPVPLSGKTVYDITKSVDAHDMCPAPYLGVKASGPGASSAYGDTTSAC